MKSHIVTIILLLLAVLAFVMRFIVASQFIVCCDILAFSFPTIAAIIEIFISDRGDKIIEHKLLERPIWKSMTKEEYNRLKEQGVLDEKTYYAIIDDSSERKDY